MDGVVEALMYREGGCDLQQTWSKKPRVVQIDGAPRATTIATHWHICLCRAYQRFARCLRCIFLNAIVYFIYGF